MGGGGGSFTFGWSPMDPAAFAEFASGAILLPSPSNGGLFHPGLYAPPHMTTQSYPAAVDEAEAARRRRQQAEEEEDAAIRLVHLLVTCAGAIQAGDYPAAHGNLADAHAILGGPVVSTATGIGRVAEHFAAALSQRLFGAPPTTDPSPQAELHRHFYVAGPHLRFAYSTANLAILDAFAGCARVHVVDLALMHGLQWADLIRALAQRPGGPPHLRITGIGPQPADGTRDELREVGLRLADLARSLGVSFSFRGVFADQLDGLRPWMLELVPGEALAVNSVLQLHRLLVDPDADPAVPAPIDTLLGWLVAGARPKVFTVVEQEADHNRPSLLERFTNALFHYAAMFDSMEAVGCRGGGRAEGYLRAEIMDVVCGEGSARAERHEPLDRWRERLARAGLVQVPFGPHAHDVATDQLIRLTSGSTSGYAVLECHGSLALGWHNRPLYTVTAWGLTPPPPGEDAAAVDGTNGGRCSTSAAGNSRNGNLAATAAQPAAAAAATVFMPY